mgnify:CR=1 FL=1
MYFRQVGDLETKMFSLPDYLESLSSIMREMKTVPDSYLVTVEHLMVLLLEHVPNLPKKIHFLCIRSILLVLLAMFPKGSCFKEVLSGFGRLIIFVEVFILEKTLKQGSRHRKACKCCTFMVVISVYQSLIRTCSCVPLVELENEEEGMSNDSEVKKVTYKDYMDIWMGLLDAPHIKVRL